MMKEMITQIPKYGMGVKRNQSLEHQDLCKRCLVWLANRVTQRGLHGRNELQLADGYVVDAIAMASLQSRFYEQFLRLRPIYGTAGKPLSVADQKRLDTWPKNEFVFIFEAKASRSDFLSTFGSGAKHENRMTPVGNFHYVVARKGVCEVDEIPEFWGLLMASGVGLRILKHPKYLQCSTATLHSIAYLILWKRTDSYHDIKYCPDCHKKFSKKSKISKRLVQEI